MTSNMTIVKLTDGREVCLSYGVPVAAFIPGRGFIKTDRKWSSTTSKHATQYAGGSNCATIVPDDVFCKLIEPLECKR